MCLGSQGGEAEQDEIAGMVHGAGEQAVRLAVWVRESGARGEQAECDAITHAGEDGAEDVDEER